MKELLLAIKARILYSLAIPDAKPDIITEEYEFLRQLYMDERNEVKRLTNELLIRTISTINEISDDRIEAGSEKNYEPVNRPSFIPWSVKQRKLEREDRDKFKKIAKEAAEKVNLEKIARSSNVEELEEALGVE